VADILSVLPSVPLHDVSTMSMFQVSAFTRAAEIRRTRAELREMWVTHSSGKPLEDEYRAVQHRLSDMLYEPIVLPERAVQQQREFEEKRRRGETYYQRKQKQGHFLYTTPLKRGRFSIMKRMGEGARGSKTIRAVPRRFGKG